MLGAGEIGIASAATVINGPRFEPLDAPDVHVDFAAGRYWALGRARASETPFLEAIGGARDGDMLVIGPYVAPDAPNLLAGNGDFSDGDTGWTAQNGALFSVVDGQGVLDGNAAHNPSFSTPVSLEIGKAYRLEASARRATLSYGGAAVLLSGLATLGTAESASPGQEVGTFATVATEGAATSTTMYAGGRAYASGATGTALYDDFALFECAPFAGFENPGFALRIVAETQDVLPGAEVTLFEGQATRSDVTRNRIRIVYDPAGQIRVVVHFAGSAQVNLVLGVVSPATRFELAASFEPGRVLAGIVGQRFVYHANAATIMPGLSVLCLGGSLLDGTWTGALEAVSIWSQPFEEHAFYGAVMDRSGIVAWGDSLTGGTGSSTPSQRYPELAKAAFSPPRPVVNRGIGGQTSTQIGARMNAVPLVVSVAGSEIPASGPVGVPEKSINILTQAGAFTGSQHGMLMGVSGQMQTDASGNWTFARQLAGAAVSCPNGVRFIAGFGLSLRECIAWIWAGTNLADPGHSVQEDVADMVGALVHDRYLVASILTRADNTGAENDAVLAINADLAADHGDRYVDVLSGLQAENDGTPSDLADVAAHLTPGSLRSDSVHLNDAGYAIVAQMMADKTVQMGW